MSHEAVQVLARWFEEVWNLRREETIDELLTANSICHTDEGPVIGPEEFRQKMYYPFLAAFPDVRVTVEEIVPDGNRVIVLWSATGTHSGDIPGLPATGRRVEFKGLTRALVVNGKMMDGLQNSNIVEVFNSLAE